MKQLYFVRHGESELNAQRIFAGQTDTPLSELGREQAGIAAKANTTHFDLIVSSPLSRALETAQIVARGCNYPIEHIMVNDMFKERSLGSLEGKSWDEYEEGSDGQTGVETDAELRERAQKGLEFLQTLPAEAILLVGHGSFSRELRALIDPSQVYEEPKNAKIIQLI